MNTIGLAEWLDNLRAIEGECPWPGPRPLGKDDASLLVGRVRARREFRTLVRTHRLLLLHGPSGVGKTSLLQAGLIPDLDTAGMLVLPNDQWGGLSEGDFESVLAAKLGLDGNGQDVFDRLGASYGDRALLVFDQFEELIRYSPSDTERVFDLIVRLNRDYDTKIVISFRSEYLHEFAGLQSRVVNFTHTELRLSELEDAQAANVILAANSARQRAGREAAVTVEAAEEIAKGWQRARREARDRVGAEDPYRRIGVLHLQALLYSLFFTAGKRCLGVEEIQGSLGSWADMRSPEVTADTFEVALRKAVDVKLQHCAEAAADQSGRQRIDAYLVDGTAWMLQRVAPHLSSAGYKLIRGMWETVRLALGGDFDALTDGLDRQAEGYGVPHQRALFDAFTDASGLGLRRDEKVGSRSGSAALDLLQADRAALAGLADDRLGSAELSTFSWACALATPEAPAHRNDPLGVTSGPVFGLTPADAFIEELRRYCFSLMWLHASSLVRVTTPIGSEPMVSLIHDGFGPALARWAQQRTRDTAGPLSAVTAPRGASFHWSRSPASPLARRAPTLGGNGDHRVLANLRWRGAWVQADIERVVFVNCDLRGAMFDGCRMTGVVFVNCLLDGAMFTECVLDGEQPLADPSQGWSAEEPVFLVPAQRALLESFRRYRSLGAGTSDALFSDLPGAPALPHQGQPVRVLVEHRRRPPERAVLDAPLLTGGMAIYGGRLSTLTVRRCWLAEGSGLTLRHTTGSGIEVVEMVDSPGHMEIFGSAIRHVTFSGDPSDDDLGAIDVLSRCSTLAELYVGRGLRGRVNIESSTLFHAWNGSPPPPSSPAEGVEFVARDCVVHGSLDVALADSRSLGEGPQSEHLAAFDDIGVADRMRRMDYRRDPAALRDRLAGA